MCRLRWICLSYSSFTEIEGFSVGLRETLQKKENKKGGFETMNKNLKKVISAVAALALSASSFVALAANYPDVDSSASYKQAVDELSALNVINGYEDGTFQPDKLVTRAEFSKMVITALGSAELAQAEAAAGIDTQFSDVKGDHWAAGFVTAAVSNSIINGMGDGTFAPDANVTYAQAMKMLVCAAGYEQWSLDRGGWPDGYMYWGNQVKIGNGVKDVTNDTEITRAQVAQMIDNVLTAPVCVNTQKYTYDQYGNKYPELQAKDGYGVDYQSILIKNHDAYKVKGTVTATNKSTGGSVKVDEVQFKIQNARNWLDQEDQISKTNDNAVEIKAAIGNSGADEYLKKYVEALVKETDDDEYEILSVALAGQNEEVTLKADDFDYENSNYTAGDYVDAGKLYFYNSGKTTSYKINADTELYVNGALYDGDFNDGVAKFVNDNNASDITLVDVPGDNNATDGIYDLVMVDYYATAVVDVVDTADEDMPTINFLAADVDANELGAWDIELDNDDISYTFTKDGNEIAAADLAQYDVLSIKFDINKNIDESSFYDVTVASKVEEGKYSLYNSKDDEYTVNGTVYKTVSTADALEQGVTYSLYIDAFGRIAYTEELAASKKIAILDSIYDVRGGEAYDVKLIFTDGTSETYELKTSGTSVANSPEVQNAEAIVFDDAGNKKAPQDRVVEYTINSSKEVTIKKTLNPVTNEDAAGVVVEGEYRANQNRIGSFKISADTTAFVNASDPKDITATSIDALTDGGYYEAYFFDKSSSDSIYRFVMITTGTGAATASTRVAVYQKTLYTENESGDSVDAYQVLVNGEEKTINLESGVDADDTLVEGDAIIYDTNASNEVTKVTKLYTNSAMLASYDDVWAAAVTDTSALINAAYVQSLTGKDPANLYFGAIVGRGTNSIEIGDVTGAVTDLRDTNDISYADDVVIYVVDYNKRSGERVSVSSASAVAKVTVPKDAMTDNQNIINWNGVEGKNAVPSSPRMALVKTVDKNATDIVVIIPKK